MTTSPWNQAVHRALTDLPAIYAECESALVARKGALQQRVSGSRMARGIALEEDAVVARADILRVLSGWASLVADEQALPRPQRRLAGDLAWFLLANLDWLRSHPAGPDFADEILEVSRRAERVVNRSGGPQVDLGSCIHTDCDAPLTLAEAAASGRTAGSGRTAVAEIRCTSGHTWPPSQWLYLARRIRRTT
jgi:hypothetical protein